ncbi:adenylate/guanylate cyclase domain-containing protein [Bradyrhizobium sp. 200]|uniref:adenylate/guanylate cyclase domain-containing protein n=1 Tax=Bradyrhizobium sp. 200 TaxID=2782665 RepID=UPI001FFF9EE8|nr:adenylate/guanylate cyclase domain-containing protein [Bradyrhizobium sp. 200]UPJ50491.1 adenylate/guanylate cyclase domain-containing protein [Bradyrhizobium sp. 200]
MNPRLRWQVKSAASVIGISTLVGAGVALAQRDATSELVFISALHGFVLSVLLTALEIYLARGPLRQRIGRLSFGVGLMLRSLVYVLVIVAVHAMIHYVRLRYGGTPFADHSFTDAILTITIAAIAINFVIQIANLIGPRTLINFFTGRYHRPREENRFVLFVDIAGSTGLAERLGGIGIHRFLDRTFRLLSGTAIDYRGEILGYVGDELIVTWPEKEGAVDARPLRCFLAMREALEHAAQRLLREFGAAPKIRGSLNFGPVIVGEIGDFKRAIVFNGDTMNAAARLEEFSRTVDGGFLAARAAIERFDTAAPIRLRDLGAMPIRGRAHAIAVMGLEEPEIKARLSGSG